MAPKPRQSIKAFTGPLTKPIETARPSLAWREDSDEYQNFLAEQNASIFRQRVAKLPLVMEHYQIPETTTYPGCFVLLALRLAMDFVAGFKLDLEAPPSKGRPKKYDKYALLGLLLRVDGYKAIDPALTDLAACERVVFEDNPALAKSGRATQRRRRARTLANLLPKARDPSLNPYAENLRPLIEALHAKAQRHEK